MNCESEATFNVVKVRQLVCMNTKESAPRRRFIATMQRLFLLLLLPIVCKVNTMQCPAGDPIPVPHAWYQPGDLLIGGIASHIFYHSSVIEFKEDPSQELLEVPQ